jgi:tRNA A37 threonylcarbamoyladenosine biosynthesis protein TsaE
VRKRPDPGLYKNALFIHPEPEPDAVSNFLSHMNMTFTNDQQHAFGQIQQFINSPERCMILKGYAGTGKTFLIGHIARWLEAEHYAVHLMAPTGRAARVINEKTGFPGHTIHRHIYNLDHLKENDAKHARFKFYFGLKSCASDEMRQVMIVDESSMVSDVINEGEFLRFGSGRLLKDLFEFARIADPTQRTKIIFVGDDAQLPPVGMNHSPALNPERLLKEHNVNAAQVELTEVVRQAGESKILEAATRVRNNIRMGHFNQLCLEPAPPEIVAVTSQDVANLWQQHYTRSLPPPMMCITYANATALHYNIATRAGLWGGDGEQPVQPGDFLMIVANNQATGLMNGDLALVKEIGGDRFTRNARLREKEKEVHVPLHFREVTLIVESPGQKPTELPCTILENTLSSSKRDITPEEQKALYIDFCTRHRDLKPNTKAFTEAILQDPLFNAVRVKYGYAATCHKAQGGEWDQAVVVFEHQRTDRAAQRWTYTAITRAKKVLLGVNLPRRTPWDGLFSTIPTSAAEPVQCEPEDLGPQTIDDTPLPPTLQLPETTPDPVVTRHIRAVHAWQQAGIRVDDLAPQLGNYLISYRLTKDDEAVRINCYFNKKGQFNLHPGAGGDAEKSLFKIARERFDTSYDITFPPDQPVLQDFYQSAIAPLAAEAGITILNVEHRQWVERYTFQTADAQKTEVDYYYNARNQFTKQTLISGAALF